MKEALSYKEKLQKGFDNEYLTLLIKVYFGVESFVRVEEIWEPTYKEGPIMHIIYFVANKKVPRETLDKNMRDFLSASGLSFSFSVLLIPICFYGEDVNEITYNEEQVACQNP
jgi:hypothetical protein